MQNQIRQFLGNVRDRLLHVRRPAPEPALVFERFRKVLNSNNHALEIIADLGEKLSGDYIFDRHYIETGVERLRGTVRGSIDGLNGLCRDRFENLYPVYDRLTGELEQLLSGREDRRAHRLWHSTRSISSTGRSSAAKERGWRR